MSAEAYVQGALLLAIGLAVVGSLWWRDRDETPFRGSDAAAGPPPSSQSRSCLGPASVETNPWCSEPTAGAGPADKETCVG